MQRALELAELGGRAVMPNPMVGAVIVCDGKIIGSGYHTKFGQAHAEVEAVRSVSDKELLSRSTLYVTLEPCNHFGKTPPCVDLILEHRIPHVVIATRDPFKEVNGKGIARLIEAGVKVEEGVLEKEAQELNKRFFTAHTLQRPYVILKWAETRDQFIARTDGSSKWISSEESRKLVHTWRSEEMAIMVGTNTASIDDPELTVRLVTGENPQRIVLDRECRLPKNLKLFDGSVSTLIFNAHINESAQNLEFIKTDLELKNILKELYSRNIISLFVEGGAKLLSSFLDLSLWDEARVFQSRETFGNGIKAPKLTERPVSQVMVGGDTLTIFRKHLKFP